MDHYGCWSVVHGDDVTTDASGYDCYRLMKQLGRFVIVKRTPGISTTGLVGRMLLCTKNHHLNSLRDALDDDPDKMTRLKSYASDETGLAPGSPVWDYDPNLGIGGSCVELVGGTLPKEGQRIVYVDGGFDLFSPGHIEFLRQVIEIEKAENGGSLPYVVAGVHADRMVNEHIGLNYPIMNSFERSLCVLQCRVSCTQCSPLLLRASC